MSEQLEKLEEMAEDEDSFMGIRLQYLIPILENYEKQINELIKKVKRLEQAQTYQPLDDGQVDSGGVDSIKIGGTD